MIKLGDKVRDKFTGFDGIVVKKTEYLYGCARIGLQSSELHDGKPVNVEEFEEQRLEIVERLKQENSETGYKVPKLTEELHKESVA